MDRGYWLGRCRPRNTYGAMNQGFADLSTSTDIDERRISAPCNCRLAAGSRRVRYAIRVAEVEDALEMAEQTEV